MINRRAAFICYAVKYRVGCCRVFLYAVISCKVEGGVGVVGACSTRCVSLVSCTACARAEYSRSRRNRQIDCSGEERVSIAVIGVGNRKSCIGVGKSSCTLCRVQIAFVSFRFIVNGVDNSRVSNFGVALGEVSE